MQHKENVVTLETVERERERERESHSLQNVAKSYSQIMLYNKNTKNQYLCGIK